MPFLWGWPRIVWNRGVSARSADQLCKDLWFITHKYLKYCLCMHVCGGGKGCSLVGVCVCAVLFYYLHWFLKQDFSNDFAMLHMLAAEENKRLLRQADVLNVWDINLHASLSFITYAPIKQLYFRSVITSTQWDSVETGCSSERCRVSGCLHHPPSVAYNVKHEWKAATKSSPRASVAEIIQPITQTQSLILWK